MSSVYLYLIEPQNTPVESSTPIIRCLPVESVKNLNALLTQVVPPVSYIHDSHVTHVEVDSSQILLVHLSTQVYVFWTCYHDSQPREHDYWAISHFWLLVHLLAHALPLSTFYHTSQEALHTPPVMSHKPFGDLHLSWQATLVEMVGYDTGVCQAWQEVTQVELG